MWEDVCVVLKPPCIYCYFLLKTTIAELFGFSRTNTTRAITDMFLQTAKYLQPTVEGEEVR